MVKIGPLVAYQMAYWGQRWRGRRRGPIRSTVLHYTGLGAIAYALGMWSVPVGIAAAGVALLLIEALGNPERGK